MQVRCMTILNLIQLRAPQQRMERTMREDEWHQLMLERQERLEEALNRAESGCAPPDDWSVIRYECGVPRESDRSE